MRWVSAMPKHSTYVCVLEYLASGMCEDEILADFPDLERVDRVSARRVSRGPGAGAAGAVRRLRPAARLRSAG